MIIGSWMPGRRVVAREVLCRGRTIIGEAVWELSKWRDAAGSTIYQCSMNIHPALRFLQGAWKHVCIKSLLRAADWRHLNLLAPHYQAPISLACTQLPSFIKIKWKFSLSALTRLRSDSLHDCESVLLYMVIASQLPLTKEQRTNEWWIFQPRLQSGTSMKIVFTNSVFSSMLTGT